LRFGQRGGWEQFRIGARPERGLLQAAWAHARCPLYPKAAPKTLQSVISNSIDIGIGLGTHAVLGAFVKGAPIRAIGASFTSADEQFYYVVADSPIRSMQDADGKTIAISTNGSASNMFALALAKHFRHHAQAAAGRRLCRNAHADADPTRSISASLPRPFKSQLCRRRQDSHHRARQVMSPSCADNDQPADRREYRRPRTPPRRAQRASCRAIVRPWTGSTLIQRRSRLTRSGPPCPKAIGQAGPGVHDPTQHGAHPHFRAGRHHGRRGEIQIYQRAADESAARRASCRWMQFVEHRHQNSGGCGWRCWRGSLSRSRAKAGRAGPSAWWCGFAAGGSTDANRAHPGRGFCATSWDSR